MIEFDLIAEPHPSWSNHPRWHSCADCRTTQAPMYRRGICRACWDRRETVAQLRREKELGLE